MKSLIMKKLAGLFSREWIPVWVGGLLLLGLCLLPTGYEEALSYKGAERCSAKILETNESTVFSIGLIKSGEQTCTVEFLSGKFKGEQAQGINLLTGSLENDKIYEVGDKVSVLISYAEADILSVNLIDHYRLNRELLLAAVFAGFLILIAGKTGIRAILSFAVTVMMIWKVLVPCLLKGVNPILLSLLVTIFLTGIIISLVYGFDKRTLSALSGGILGIVFTAILGFAFTRAFKIHGAVMPHAESLLYSGHEYLDLTSIFIASIFIGASGAIMDLTVDITSAVVEVISKKPDISWQEATQSGMNVGRAAMGTMTTTLLLAYSGGYVALLMVFMAQGTPIYNILNYKYVAAEILHTMVGSFGLVTVAPFTALTSGILLTKRKD